MDNLPGNSSGISLGEIIEVIESDQTNMESRRDSKAYIKILEQPAPKSLRFRYPCEGRSAGSLPGVNSTPENKTYPTIQIVGHKGRVLVVVSCVTKDDHITGVYRPHPHNLVGREECKRGVCTVEVKDEQHMTQSFDHLGIQCVKKKDIEEQLAIREKIRVDPFNTGFSHKNQPGSIDLNAVRLCFQAFIESIPGSNKFNTVLKPVVSDIIYDKKALCDLAICKLSHASAPVDGGQKTILLCEKVAKEDIAVYFYEEQNDQIVWQGYGDFNTVDVHKQVAITFKTPAYKTVQVENPVKVYIQLQRPSDGETSEPLPFWLTPLVSGGYSSEISPKRKRPDVPRTNTGLLREVNRDPVCVMTNPQTSPPGVTTVKREPIDGSPGPFLFGGLSPSPMLQRTPSPHYPGSVSPNPPNPGTYHLVYQGTVTYPSALSPSNPRTPNMGQISPFPAHDYVFSGTDVLVQPNMEQLPDVYMSNSSNFQDISHNIGVVPTTNCIRPLTSNDLECLKLPELSNLSVSGDSKTINLPVQEKMTTDSIERLATTAYETHCNGDGF